MIDGEILLLDGGTGSELQRRGVNVLKDATDKLEAWSATANIDNPDVVQQVHQDYLRVGADIITSNNFWTTPTAMEWREMGAQIIGSCCATGPEHILAMKPVVKG